MFQLKTLIYNVSESIRKLKRQPFQLQPQLDKILKPLRHKQIQTLVYMKEIIFYSKQ